MRFSRPSPSVPQTLAGHTTYARTALYLCTVQTRTSLTGAQVTSKCLVYSYADELYTSCGHRAPLNTLHWVTLNTPTPLTGSCTSRRLVHMHAVRARAARFCQRLHRLGMVAHSAFHARHVSLGALRPSAPCLLRRPLLVQRGGSGEECRGGRGLVPHQRGFGLPAQIA